MAFQSYWFFTNLPSSVIDIIEKDIVNVFDQNVEDSVLLGGDKNNAIRDSKNAWIPTSHWIGGFLWHYAERANRENFLYDLRNIDLESLQYTVYEKGHFYEWHTDSSLPTHYKPVTSGNNQETLVQDFLNLQTEYVRKLTFVLQLSDPNDYEGGELQIKDDVGQIYTAPKDQGTMILFDSRSLHRVTEITRGTRKSIVGWIVGPRWK
jgi:PKHD-type hydroxylase